MEQQITPNTVSPLGELRREIEIKLIAGNVFGIDALRPDQITAIQWMLKEGDLFLNQPTSWGKSICYQLPAYMLRDKGPTVVISPLVALMTDQVEAMEQKGVKVTTLHSQQTVREKRVSLKKFSDKDLALIYIAPETFCTEAFIKQASKLKIQRLVVDESHCVSLWGHDFRPSFLKIPQFRDRIGFPPLACVTATAPVLVRDDILASLKLERPLQISSGPDRPNLDYEIERFPAEYLKQRKLLEYVKEAASENEPCLIYCRRVKTVEEVAALLKNAGHSPRTYHAQMSDNSERSASFRLFMDGVSNLMVATSAFGMGINKPNIRHVIHYELPASLEEYYQQAGRAGRDGLHASCILFSSTPDIRNQFKYLSRTTQTREDLYNHYTRLWSWLTADELQKTPPTLYLKKPEDSQKRHPMLEAKDAVRLAMLEEFGLIEKRGRRCTLLINPINFKNVQDFPITQEIVDGKISRDETKLRVMLYYANSTTPRQIIFDHFVENSVVERAKVKYDMLANLQQEKVVDILSMIALKDRKSGALQAYLRAVGKPLLTRNPVYGAFEHYTVAEVKSIIEIIVNAGLLNLIKVGDKSVLSLSKTGREYLENLGVNPPAIKSLKGLKERLHSIEAKLILKVAIQDFYDTQRLSIANPSGWWDSFEIFRDEKFTFFGKEITGQELVEAYFGRTYTRTRKNNPILRHTKDFLNHIFDNRIKTTF